MKDVKDLHRSLYQAIHKAKTDKCLTVIDSLLEASHRDGVNYLDKYSHFHFGVTPLLQCLGKKNSVVAMRLLEKGCKLHMDNGSNKKCLTSSSLNAAKYVFEIIGMANFEKVFMKIFEDTQEVILDKYSNTVLHMICEKKLTLWLQMVLNSAHCRDLLSFHNKCGYLPMHVAAGKNFIDFFKFVPVALPHRSDCIKNAVPSEDHNSIKEEKHESHDTNDLYESEDRVTGKFCDKKSHLVCLSEERKLQKEKVISSNENDVHVTHLQSSYWNHSKIDIDEPIKRGCLTVLHIAAGFKYKELVKRLLDLGANVNGSPRPANSCSPLFYCLLQFTPLRSYDFDSYFLDVCTQLVDAGTNANAFYTFFCYDSEKSTEEKDIITTLHLAAKIGCKQLLHILVNKGADPSKLSKNLGKLPLQLALEGGHEESAEVLLSEGLYPDTFLAHFMDKESNNLMHSAARVHQGDIITKLMNYGCPLDKPNINNVLPLDKAIFHGNVVFINLVLSKQPEIVNLCKHMKVCPPLHLAAKSNLRSLPLCQILLSYGADIYAKAYGKNMAYQAAIRNFCYHNTVYLCKQMSRPFTFNERNELLEHVESGSSVYMSRDLAMSLLNCRMENVPSLLSHCLDVIRQVFIQNQGSFKSIECLPLPNKMIRALRYLDAKNSL